MTRLSWKGGDDYYMRSEPPGFIINKTFRGEIICYSAVRAGSGEGPDILHVERNLSPDDDAGRLAALDRCKAACDEAAGVLRDAQ
jgi:hypothetical protein